MLLPLPIQVFAEAYIYNPMQFVFDSPVLADGLVQPCCIRLKASDVIAGLPFARPAGLAVALGFDPHYSAQRWPLLGLFQRIWLACFRPYCRVRIVNSPMFS